MASSFVHDFRGRNIEEAIIGYPFFNHVSTYFSNMTYMMKYFTAELVFFYDWNMKSPLVSSLEEVITIKYAEHVLTLLSMIAFRRNPEGIQESWWNHVDYVGYYNNIIMVESGLQPKKNRRQGASRRKKEETMPFFQDMGGQFWRPSERQTGLSNNRVTQIPLHPLW